MGFFDGFAEGLASAIDDIRHQVVEQPWFGQQTTGNIELPQVEAPTIEAPAINGEVMPPDNNFTMYPSGVQAVDQVIDTSWADISDAMQSHGIEPPQLAAPEISAPSIEVGGGDD